MKKIVSLLLSLAIMASLAVPAFAASPTFSDVSADFWAYKQIEQTYAAGAVAGTYYNQQTGERHFSPSATLTMAQFITILTRAFYPKQVKEYEGNDGPWYEAFRQAALKNDLFDGTSGIENLEKPITRYDMAAIMANLLQNYRFEPTKEQLSSSQSKIGDYSNIPEQYQDAVKTVFSADIIVGTDSKGTFNGQNYMNRAQAAVVYCRLAEKIKTLSNDKQEPEEGTKEETVDVFNVSFSDYSTVQAFADTINQMTPAYREGYLTNGKEITEENIQDFLDKIKEILPQGTTWNNTDKYNYYTPKFGTAGGCASFAMLISDWMFGEDAPLLRNQNFKAVRPGDFIWYKNASGTVGHFIVIMDVNGTTLKVCDGNRNASVYWTTTESLTRFLNNTDGYADNSFIYYRY